MNDPRPGFLPIDLYLQQPRDPQTWLIKPLLPVSGAMLLFGQPKTGKSYLGIQLANALTGHTPDFLGFPVVKSGNVLYLQLDTPRGVWSLRFEDMISKGFTYDRERLLLADRESVEFYPFDVLNPKHCVYLRGLVSQHNPTAVIIDTLREAHSGDSDSDTSMRNVIVNMVGICHPAALIIISHSRKTQADVDKDIMEDHRGSSYTPGRMDVILRLTKSRLYYAGRSIEEGNLKLERQDSGLWLPKNDEAEKVALTKVLTDPTLTTMRAKARALAVLTSTSEEACMSRIRRATS